MPRGHLPSVLLPAFHPAFLPSSFRPSALAFFGSRVLVALPFRKLTTADADAIGEETVGGLPSAAAGVDAIDDQAAGDVPGDHGSS